MTKYIIAAVLLVFSFAYAQSDGRDTVNVQPTQKAIAEYINGHCHIDVDLNPDKGKDRDTPVTVNDLQNQINLTCHYGY